MNEYEELHRRFKKLDEYDAETIKKLIDDLEEYQNSNPVYTPIKFDTIPNMLHVAYHVLIYIGGVIK